MKKFLYNILLLIFILSPVRVLAEGYISVSPDSLTIEQGSSKTFTITAYNAIGDVSIKSDNISIASVNTGEWGTGMVEEKQSKSTTVTVTGKNIGTTTITLSIDAATFDGDDLAGQTKTISVNVIAKSISEPEPEPEPKPSRPSNNLSKNNKLKDLKVEGYEITKINNNNFSLIVESDVDNVNITALAEDSKATIVGIGNHKLKLGENKIQVIVTSQSGNSNTINLNITRKNGYYLEDLESLLSNLNEPDADIIINANSKLTNDHLKIIKDSKKTIRFNYYDENKKLIYVWTISGSEIKELNEFITTIKFTTDNKQNIYKLSNYADGLYINFIHDGDLPEGTKIKLFVGDKFENESNVNLYYYNIKKNSLEIINNDLKVNDGYIEFDIEHCSDYFVTMSNIFNSTQTKNTSINLFWVIAIIITIVLISFIFLKLHKKRLKNHEVNNLTNSTLNNNLNVNSTTNKENEVQNSIITNVEETKTLVNEFNNTTNSTLNQDLNVSSTVTNVNEVQNSVTANAENKKPLANDVNNTFNSYVNNHDLVDNNMNFN